MTRIHQSKAGAAPEVVVLLSGGIDSATCLDFYLEFGRQPCGLFVDYQQLARDQELKAAQSISKHYGVPLYSSKWSGRSSKTVGVVPARNAFLLIAALMERPPTATVIAMGIHAGTEYPDCSPGFVAKMRALFDLYAGGSVQVAAPFLDWSKSEIWAHAKTRGVPVNLTYSCEAGSNSPCGECLSCRDRMAFA